MEKMPEENQTIKDMFDEPVYFSTPVGDTNIPDPMMLPTITVTPLSKFILTGNRILSSNAVRSSIRGTSFIP